MHVLVAPDSFKGSLDPATVALAIAQGWQQARPADELRLVPLADGGDGTLDAILASATGWVKQPVDVLDPLGRPARGAYLVRDGEALIEMARASGLALVAPADRDALAASTFGTGQALTNAIDHGAVRIVLGLGGSATSDGGTGLLRALGARFLDANDAELAHGGGALADLARIDLSGLEPKLADVHLTIASDVTNPLLGINGAAAVYGPQKGANAAQVARLETGLAHYADLLETATGRQVRDLPGAGAAGGTGGGLLAVAGHFASFEVRPGVDVVMELTGFDQMLEWAHLVLTGEGLIDEQTGHGKTAQGVARRAHALAKPCICFGGGVTQAGAAALAQLNALAVPVVERPMTVEQAMAAGREPLVRAAERVARLGSLFAA